jgi:hypothetical protein
LSSKRSALPPALVPSSRLLPTSTAAAAILAAGESVVPDSGLAGADDVRAREPALLPEPVRRRERERTLAGAGAALTSSVGSLKTAVATAGSSGGGCGGISS